MLSDPHTRMQAVTRNGFDPSREALHFVSSGGDLQQLTRNAAELDEQVRSAVSDQWRPLLAAAQTLAETRSGVSRLLSATSNLEQQVNMLQFELREPAAALAARRQHLHALVSTASTLRSFQRFLQLVSKLRSQLASPQELPVAAASLAEVFGLLQRPLLSSVALVAKELPMLKLLRLELRSRSLAVVHSEFGLSEAASSLSTLSELQIVDPPNVVSALVILFYLGELPELFTVLTRRLNAPPRITCAHRFASHVHGAVSRLAEDMSNPRILYFAQGWSLRQFNQWSAAHSSDSLLGEIAVVVRLVSESLVDRIMHDS